MNKLFADVIVDISHEKVDRPFQYRVPEDMREELKEGMCVTVPFGASNKPIKGYVIAFRDYPEWDEEKIKDITEITKGGITVMERQILLAAHLKKNYGSTMIQALKTVLPAKKTVRMAENKSVRLLISEEEAKDRIATFEGKHQVAKGRLLRALAEVEELPMRLITSKLHVGSSTVQALARQGLVEVLTKKAYRNPVRIKKDEDIRKTLSEEQQAVVNTVLRDYDQGNPGTYLLHGITGSGKTEVYMNLIEAMIERGKQAIVLIPEIALTYQTLLRFYTRFGDRVSVLNSTLSGGEKYDRCERAKAGEIDIMIGPRTALFTPFPNIGIIVMDEEQENSYKSENSPKYHAREVAQEIARMHGAAFLMGSATPSIDAYFQAKSGNCQMFTLTKRLTGGTLPKVYTVDLREELKAGNRSIFSRKLTELMQERLEKKEQILLFLNRRGYAGFISCRACGHVMTCPHCSVSLSEHRGGYLVCHYCGYTEPKVKKCPSCSSPYIAAFRAGTEQIEEKLHEMFPAARVLRMDADTTGKKDDYDKILSAFANEEADILIGTQMIVKGHDFPKVTLVGVLAADLSLSAGDYRAAERTFCLLTQAAGRAGRGKLSGEAVIQTYQPEHYSVMHAANQDYISFYEEEILYREMLRYPPVCHMMAVQIFAEKEENAKALSKELADFAKSYIRTEENTAKRLTVIGPAPAAISKIQDVYRYVFYVKYEDYNTLIAIKDGLEERVMSMQLKKESMQIDFDPVNAF